MIFISGILAGLGTIWLLFNNGVMLGAFQYYFFSKGLGWQSVLVIWIHGTLEISSIIISGAAGLVLAKSLIFPGTYKRLFSLKRGAKRWNKNDDWTGPGVYFGCFSGRICYSLFAYACLAKSVYPDFISLFYHLVFYHLSNSSRPKAKNASKQKT